MFASLRIASKTASAGPQATRASPASPATIRTNLSPTTSRPTTQIASPVTHQSLPKKNTLIISDPLVRLPQRIASYAIFLKSSRPISTPRSPITGSASRKQTPRILNNKMRHDLHLRRDFLRYLAGSAAAASVSPILRATIPAAENPTQNSPFSEVPASASGITFVHTSGHSSQKFLPESTGPGCAFLDYDNDGWMDIYLVNSGPCDFWTPPAPLRNALYRNNRDGTFTDVTEKAGVPGGGYGMGVAVGDYNADGFPDFYVTQYGRSILYRNNGDGTFTDVTERAGVAAPGWASSAVWFDYDNDGRLDLFVCQFADYDKLRNQKCGDARTG